LRFSMWLIASRLDTDPKLSSQSDVMSPCWSLPVRRTARSAIGLPLVPVGAGRAWPTH